MPISVFVRTVTNEMYEAAPRNECNVQGHPPSVRGPDRKVSAPASAVRLGDAEAGCAWKVKFTGLTQSSQVDPAV
jgi:hypothetical protein